MLLLMCWSPSFQMFSQQFLQAQSYFFINIFQVSQYLSKFGNEGSDVKINFDHGTTTLAFKFKGGVIVAVDSRATAGPYIGKTVMKACMSPKIDA